MLYLKLIIVPLFIAIVTLVGRRWGPTLAGLLAGFPVVAGPIVIFIAIEHGTSFAQLTALSAIHGTLALLVFTVTYCWTSLRFQLTQALCIALLAWLVFAVGINYFSPSLAPSIFLAFSALISANFLLPSVKYLSPKQPKFNDLLLRMLIGALITLLITTLASHLGPILSGTLATFPIISIVLAIFVHLSDGPEHVIEMYRGMLGGLYSFVIFFTSLAFLWPHSSILRASVTAISLSFLMQVIVQFFLKKRLEN